MGKLDTKQLVSEMANLSVEDLICGPGTQCAVDKNNEHLRQVYEDAQNNFESAPIELEDAKRAYQDATLGTAEANDVLENDYTLEATSNMEQLNDEFQKKIVFQL